jgi:hypothetical protein
MAVFMAKFFKVNSEMVLIAFNYLTQAFEWILKCRVVIIYLNGHQNHMKWFQLQKVVIFWDELQIKIWLCTLH